MKRYLVTAAIALFATAAMADPVADRIAIMKGVGGATRDAAAIAKGEQPFDAAKVQQLMQVYIDAAAKMPTLYPADTQDHPDTKAGPKVWEDPAGFKAEFDKFAADAAAAATAADAAAFGPAFGKVAAHCKACHEVYRKS